MAVPFLNSGEGQDLLLDELRRFVGTEYPPRLDTLPDEPVRVRDIRNYTESIADLNPLWIDPEYARAQGYTGIIAPPGFVETFAPNYRAYRVWEGAEHLRRTFPFDYPFGDTVLPRILLLSEEIQPQRPVAPGDIVIASSLVKDINISPSKTLGKLVTVTLEKRYSTPAGELLALVYWKMAAAEREFRPNRENIRRDPLLSAQRSSPRAWSQACRLQINRAS
jgi:acyl dehydratase